MQNLRQCKQAPFLSSLRVAVTTERELSCTRAGFCHVLVPAFGLQRMLKGPKLNSSDLDRNSLHWQGELRLHKIKHKLHLSSPLFLPTTIIMSKTGVLKGIWLKRVWILFACFAALYVFAVTLIMLPAVQMR